MLTPTQGQRGRHDRYDTRAGVVLGMDDVDSERLLMLRLKDGHRMLAPAGAADWAVGQQVEVLIDLALPPLALGLAVRLAY